jgi:divalent metal cation (Fe/Co/Zn/Cd) transporter
MLETPKPPSPTPVADAHTQRSKVETVVAVLGAVFGGVAMLSGLHPVAQGMVGGAVAIVIIYAGIAHLRAYNARRRRR